MSGDTGAQTCPPSPPSSSSSPSPSPSPFSPVLNAAVDTSHRRSAPPKPPDRDPGATYGPNTAAMTRVLPASTQADPSAWGRTPTSTLVRRSSAGRRPSRRRPSGDRNSMPRISLPSRDERHSNALTTPGGATKEVGGTRMRADWLAVANKKKKKKKRRAVSCPCLCVARSAWCVAAPGRATQRWRSSWVCVPRVLMQRGVVGTRREREREMRNESGRERDGGLATNTTRRTPLKKWALVRTRGGGARVGGVAQSLPIRTSTPHTHARTHAHADRP